MGAFSARALLEECSASDRSAYFNSTVSYDWVADFSKRLVRDFASPSSKTLEDCVVPLTMLGVDLTRYCRGWVNALWHKYLVVQVCHLLPVYSTFVYAVAVMRLRTILEVSCSFRAHVETQAGQMHVKK